MQKELEELLSASFAAGAAYEKSKKIYKNQHGSYTDKKAVQEHHLALKKYFNARDSFNEKFEVKKKETLFQKIKSWF